MRSRMPVLASAAVAAAAAAVPAVAGAAPVHSRGLSIHTTSNNIVAGSPVTIYGRLRGADDANQTITLYHRIYPKRHFTVIGRTTTNSAGQYDFPRADGVVTSDRSWFVRGPGLTHSRTILERVTAELSINASKSVGTTRHPITFTGSVTPANAGTPVSLQVENAAGTAWHTVARGRVAADGSYSIAHAWRTADSYNVRVAFPGNGLNGAAASDPVTVVINQRQAPYFTIGTSQAIVAANTPTTISGTLDTPHTSTPEANAEVGLYEHVPGTGRGGFTFVSSAMTDGSGNYSFTAQGVTNELYQVRTMNAPSQATAQVFQAVQDTVSLTAPPTTSSVGSTITFSGTVSPDKTGHSVYLEKLGADGHWQIVQTGRIAGGSTFSLNWTFGAPGTKQFRVRVVGGPVNVGGASAPVSVAVSTPAASQLPGN